MPSVDSLRYPQLTALTKSFNKCLNLNFLINCARILLLVKSRRRDNPSARKAAFQSEVARCCRHLSAKFSLQGRVQNTQETPPLIPTPLPFHNNLR